MCEILRESKNTTYRNKGNFRPFEVDLTDFIEFPILSQYVKGKEKEELERSDWSIEISLISFEDIKGTFDPIIERLYI